MISEREKIRLEMTSAITERDKILSEVSEQRKALNETKIKKSVLESLKTSLVSQIDSLNKTSKEKAWKFAEIYAKQAQYLESIHQKLILAYADSIAIDDNVSRLANIKKDVSEEYSLKSLSERNLRKIENDLKHAKKELEDTKKQVKSELEKLSEKEKELIERENAIKSRQKNLDYKKQAYDIVLKKLKLSNNED